MPRTIGIVAKPDLEALEIVVELRKWLRERGVQVLLDGATAEKVHRVRGATPARLRKADLLVSVGGDGTLLQAAHMLGGAEVPIFGVNAGYLGFLTEISRARMYAVLEEVLDGQMSIEERMLLRVALQRDGGQILSGLVLNDAVVAKGALARISEVVCSVDGNEVARYRADGLIVATPTGSTAYSLSAGGPIVIPTLEAMILTPISPHALSQRPLVIPRTSEVRLAVSPRGGNLYLTLDGQKGKPLRAGDVVVVREARRKVLLVRDPRLDFFGVLREKLGWGS
jgi:NAD+ kinase